MSDELDNLIAALRRVDRDASARWSAYESEEERIVSLVAERLANELARNTSA